ncbi:MAG: TonB-dependent receptor [Bacteroidales bacterium]|nr:TonB-dependent receptor [Bacteroidales bacterium]
MTKKAFIFTLMALAALAAYSQKTVEGVVYDESTKEPIPSVNIFWSDNVSTGVASDLDGRFSLKNDSQKARRLIVRCIGYTADTLLITPNMRNIKAYLKSETTSLGTAIVKGRQSSSYVDKLSLENTSGITKEGLKHLACCNLGESFENSASIDVGYADAVSGAKQIQLLGLTGVYSQLLLENVYFLRGLSAPFGLGYVPGSWLDGISISKGVATVKQGYETITGLINLEYEKPQKGDPLFINLYANSEARGEINAKANHKFNDRLSTGLLVHGSYNGLYSYDHAGMSHHGTGDGFMDNPKQGQVNIVNRWNYEIPNGLCSQTLINYTHDYRQGGQMDFRSNMRGNSSLYGLGGNVDRLYFFTKNGAPLGKTASFGTQIAATYFKQDAYYGLTNYLGREGDLYFNGLINQQIRGGHYIDYGVSLRYSNQSEDLFSKPYLTALPFISNTDANRDNFFREETVPGAFGQFTFVYGDKFLTTLGVRYDYNTFFEQHIITPRLHFRWTIVKDLILRGAAGKGYRTSNIIADNFGLLASSRQIIIKGNELLKMEEAYNAGLNLVYSFKAWGGRDFTIMMDYYHTNFVNQTVMDLEQDANQAIFYNLDGKSYSNAAQLDIMFSPFERFDVTLAGRYNDVKTTYNGILMDKPYTSKFKGLIVLSYRTKFDKWTFDLTTQFNGKQRIPLNVGDKQGYSDPYVFMLAQITRKFKYVDVYIGSENLTNYTQDTPVIGADQPFSTSFDASVVYAPIMRRTFYAGLRWTVK